MLGSHYSDKYEVLLSTTGNSIADFTVSLKPLSEAANYLSEITLNLSQYEGQMGYIAIHHVFEDGYRVSIHEFGIYEPVEAGSWVELTTDEEEIKLSGLTAETPYEMQVQSDCGLGVTSNWVETTFTTTEEMPNTVYFYEGTGDCEVVSLTCPPASTITLPTATIASNEWTFFGWATAPVNETTAAPATVSSPYAPAEDLNLYAIYYNAVSGSTVVTLKAETLNKLGEGTHTVKLTFDDGETAVTLNVTANPDSPDTGDYNGIYTVLFTLSISVITVLFFRKKKLFS